MTLNKLNFY